MKVGRAGAGTWGRSGNSYHTHLLLNNTTFTLSTPYFDASHLDNSDLGLKNYVSIISFLCRYDKSVIKHIISKFKKFQNCVLVTFNKVTEIAASLPETLLLAYLEISISDFEMEFNFEKKNKTRETFPVRDPGASAI